MSATESMELVHIGPILIILALLITPWAIKAAIEDFQALTDLINK